MKVYLLLVNDEQFFFYSDESEIDESREEDPAPASGLWGWLQTRWHRFADGLSRVGCRRRALGPPELGLAAFADAPRRDDAGAAAGERGGSSFITRLRSTADDVARIWQDYLARKWRRHVLFLAGNALVAPPALVLLWPLPGPNLIGYWFAYRAIHHWLIVRGIGKVRNGRVPTHYHAEAALDVPVQRDGEGKARHEAIEGDGHRLDEYLNRTSRSTGDGSGVHSLRRRPPSTAPKPRSTGRRGRREIGLSTSRPGRLTDVDVDPDANLVLDTRPRRPGAARLVQHRGPELASRCLRIGLALAFPWVPRSWRGGLVVAAGLSDLFDGRLSRALQGTSTFGQILDPLADKLFVGIVLLTLAARGRR